MEPKAIILVCLCAVILGGCTVHFQDYEEIGKSLKPFSLQVR